jgi:3-dehydroquinate dehydratase-1
MSAGPQVVATVTMPEDLEFLRSNPRLADEVDWLEFRLDDLREHLDEAESVAATFRGRLLITARHPDEGGKGDLPEAKRFALLRRFLPFAGWMDVELRTVPGAADLVQEAKGKGVKVIGSFHDFQAMPPDAQLGKAIATAMEHGLDAAKLAMRMERIADIFVVAAMVESSPIPLSAMGMGPVGKLSRLVLARAGSILNYGYLQTPNAPGQWPARELRRLIGEI